MKNKSLIILSLLSTMTWAQQNEKLPGNTTLPSTKEQLEIIAGFEKGECKYSVEDFFKNAKLSAFKLSPDGNYFSFRENDDKGKRHLYVRNLKTNTVTKVVEENEELIRDYWWKNNERIMFTKDKGGNENFHIYGINIDGSNLKDLTPFENVRAELLNELKEQKDFIIVSLNKENPEIFEPYKLNVSTGELLRLYENKDVANPIIGYDFDKDGKLRAITQQVNNGVDFQFLYRESETSPFVLIDKYNPNETNFYILNFSYNPKNIHEAYVLSNKGIDKNQIIRYDLKEKKIIEVLYKNETFDVSGIVLSRKRNYEIDSWDYAGEKQEIIPVSETYKKMFATLKTKFADKSFVVYDHSDNEDKYLFYVYSDKINGQIYLYNASDAQMTLIVDVLPHLKEELMATVRPIKFQSRDGFTVYGYLTIPKGAENKKSPLIVNPHGGPYGVRDNWGFNRETQLFASRGYLTLQVNYRGSGGYGKKFTLAGSKQIGRNMLNDLEDGVAYVKSLNLVDGDKVAIYGGSYGGLATLGSLVKTPDMYKCGVDYVGVSNLFTFMNTIPAYWKPYIALMHEQWYNPNNPEEKKIMEAVSPALNTDKITKPLLIVQGANDPRVNIDESDQVVIALRKRGIEVPYMVKYNEGHGFGHEENRIEFYKTMTGFFSKHLK